VTQSRNGIPKRILEGIREEGCYAANFYGGVDH